MHQSQGDDQKPTVLQPRFGTIPHELGRRDQWAVWTYENRDGRWTKPPYSARGSYAKSNDPATWLLFFEARQLYEEGGFDGVGYMLSAEDPYSGIDLDDCRNPETGEIAPWAQQIVDRFKSYAEITPSGTGLRIWVRGKLPGKGRRKGSVEVYSSGRFLAVTGHHLDGTPTTIEDRQAELDAFMAETFGADQSSAGLPASGWEPEELTAEDEQAIQERRERDEQFDLLWQGEVGIAWGDGTPYPSQSESDLALCNKLRALFGPNPGKVDAAFRKSGLMRPKWDERHGAQTYGQLTLTKALSDAPEEPTHTMTEPTGGSNDAGDGTVAGDSLSQGATIGEATREDATTGMTGADAGSALGASEDDAEDQAKPYVVPASLIPLYPEQETHFDEDEGIDVIKVQGGPDGSSTLVGEFVALAREIAPGLPADWPVIALLAGVSVLVPHIHFENLSLNLWMLGIAAQGTGKGNLFEAVERIVGTSGKALASNGPQFADIVSEDPQAVGDRPFNLYTSGSPEGLLRTASRKPALVLFEEAAGFFDQAAKREYQAGIKQTLCRLYDGRGGSHQLKKAGDSIHVVDPHVSLVAAINKDDFVRKVTPADFTSGFLSRMLLIAADVRKVSPVRVPGRAVWEDLGRKLAAHLLKFQDVKWAEFNSRNPRTLGELVRARGTRLRVGEELFWAKLKEYGVVSTRDEEINLDAPQVGDTLETPEGRDIARAKKLAALFELLSDTPRVETYRDGDYMPYGAKVGDQYLSIRDENILRAVSLVLMCRAYARRALGWLGTSEDEIEQKKIIQVVTQHPGFSESRLGGYVHSRGAVYFKRNLEVLERSGDIRKKRAPRGGGDRYYPGHWTDEDIRAFEDGPRRKQRVPA